MNDDAQTIQALQAELTATRQRAQEAEVGMAERDRFFLVSVDLMAVAGQDGYFKRTNPAFTQLLGWTSSELLAAPWAFFVHPDDVAMTQAKFQRLAEGDATLDFENRYRCSHGAYRWLSWRAFSRGDQIYAVGRNVTEQKVRTEADARQSIGQRARLVVERQDAQRQATESERLTRYILDSAGEGILGLDSQGRTAFANPAAAKMLGYTVDELVGKRQHALIHHTHPNGEHYPEDACPIMAVLTNGKPHAITEEVFWCKDGTSIPVEYVSNPIQQDGQVLGAVVTFRNVTERRATEHRMATQVEALRMADTMKDQFLGILSHELRTPINAIMGFGSVLDDELIGPLTPEQLKYTQKVLVAADALLALVNDLLDMSRIQAGKFTIEAVPTAFAGAVDSVVADLDQKATTKQIALRNHVTADLPLVLADEQRVTQVIFNLIGNALKFSQPGDWVEVRAHVEGDFLRCEVEDSGPGIDPAAQATLFDPFTQVDMTSTRRSGGVGLGLTICKSLVETHGGQIGLRSQVGEGTTFWFTLPLNAVNGHLAEGASDPSGAAQHA